MTFGFQIGEIDSSAYGLSFVEKFSVSVGSTHSKDYSYLDRQIVAFLTVTGNFADNVVPTLPVVSMAGGVLTVNGTSANVATDVIVLCR